MKKMSLWFATFVIIGMLIGMFYSFFVQKVGRNDNSSLLPIPGMSESIQLGSLIAPSSEVVGGVALDPYRDSSLSGTQRLYKGIAIMPAIEINLDCSTADTEASLVECETHKKQLKGLGTGVILYTEKRIDTHDHETISAESPSTLSSF